MDSPTTPHRQQRPAYPVLKTTSSASSAQSLFHSSSSMSSLSSQGSVMSPTTPSRTQMTSAPLPSPSAGTQPASYFGSLNANQFYQQQQTQQPQGQQYEKSPQQFGQFDFLAEAAKRAQVAVMMREFEACDLS